MIQRRSFLTGLISLVAAPAIVRAGSLMPVKAMVVEPRYLSGTAIRMMQQQADAEWRTMVEFRRQITREYIRENLFTPYLGDLLGSVPVRWPAS